MATKPEDKKSNTLLWIAGTAAVTAFVIYYVNKELKTREDFQRMRLLDELNVIKGMGAGA